MFGRVHHALPVLLGPRRALGTRHRRFPGFVLRADRMRAMLLVTSTPTISTSAAAHACCWSCVLGDSELTKMLSGIEFIG